MKQKSLKLNMMLNLIRTLLGVLYPLITFPYVSRVLGPEGVGKVNFSQSIIGYFALISSFGIGTYAIREVSKVRDDAKMISVLSVEILIINLLTTLAAYLAFFVILELVPSLHPYRVLLYICSLTMLLTTLGMEWLYIAEEDYTYITIRAIIIQVLSLTLLFVLVRTKNDYINYAILLVIASAGSNIWNLIHSSKYISLPRIEELHIFRHFKFLLVFFITAATATLHTLIDQSMLGFMLGDYEVGIYVTGVKISNVIISIICSVSTILFPRLSYLAKNGSGEEWKPFLDKTILFLIMITLPVVSGLIILREPIVLLLTGTKYIDSIPVLVIMAFTVPLVCFTHLFGNLLFMAQNKERWTLYSVIVGTCANIILNYLFIPKFGAEGAAVASVASESFILTVQIILLKRITSINTYGKQVLRYAFYASIMGVSMCIINLVEVSMILRVLLSALVGMIVYAALLWREKNLLFLELLQIVMAKLNHKQNNAKI